MSLHDELARMRHDTAPHDVTRLAALDKATNLGNVPGFGATDVWDGLNETERDAVAEVFEEDTRTWTEDEGFSDGEGW